MCKRLTNYIERREILYKGPFGFRSKHSTVQAVISITDKIQRAIEDGLFSCGIFLDLSKAFDTVNHQILITKLEHYGIRGITKDWFISYLENRKQFVSIGSSVSDELVVPCGVPQGSVLGPLLFLLYMNDFNNSSKVFDFHLFATDSNLFCTNKSVLDMEQVVNDNIVNINSWLNCNKLSLNIDKTNFVIFHPPQKKITSSIKIFINQVQIKQETSLKYLGIYIDCNLNWKSHIQHISKKIKRSIGMLCKIRHFVTSHVITQFYYSLIYPYLTYGITLWGNTYISNLNPIITLQKRVVRIITFSKFDFI